MLRIGVVALAASALLMVASCTGDRPARKGEETAKVVPLVQKEGTWQGGLLGGAWGAPFTATAMTAAVKAAEEAARENRPTAYIRTDGFQRVEAYPGNGRPSGGCRGVRVLFFQEGLKVGEEIQTVCPP